ncbi:MAG TPA: hypothetical protein ENN35_09230 [Deltaproteobacteria bacterium]|nr:hypothetical protein [Deltaproteobacteria bacterium]
MILIVIVLAAAVLLWFYGDAVYESHRRTRDNHPLVFTITGINAKYIDDRDAWIRHFRRQLVLAVLLFITVLLAISFQ